MDNLFINLPIDLIDHIFRYRNATRLIQLFMTRIALPRVRFKIELRRLEELRETAICLTRTYLTKCDLEMVAQIIAQLNSCNSAEILQEHIADVRSEMVEEDRLNKLKLEELWFLLEGGEGGFT